MEGKELVLQQPAEMEAITTGAAPRIGIAELAEHLFRARKGRVLTLGQASEQIGVSVATLSRLERQRHRHPGRGEQGGNFAPDTRTLAAVARWLNVPLGQIVGEEASTAPQGNAPRPKNFVMHREGESVPEMVEAHLRADRRLDDEAAVALAQMFRMAYDQFSRLHPARPATEGFQEEER